MIWSLLGLFLMGISFPKCWLTERKWPNPATHTHDRDRSWMHNCKDDFTDDVDGKVGDREWWIKFMGFVIIVLFLTVVFLVLLYFIVE